MKVICDSCGRDMTITRKQTGTVKDNHCRACTSGSGNLPSEQFERSIIRPVEWFEHVPHEETDEDGWFSAWDDEE